MRGLAQSRVLRTVKGLVPVVLIGFGLAGAVAPRAAQAQFFGGWGNEGWGNEGWGGLRPGEINRAIAQQGFRVIAPLRRNGAVFVADVLDRRGHRERLVVAALDAQILQRFYLDDPRLPGHIPRDALAGVSPMQPMDRADRGDLVPPANIPNAGRQNSGLPDPADDQRSGDQAYGGRNADDGFDGFGDTQRAKPAQRPIKPQRPRIVERTPDTPAPRDLTPPVAKPRQKPAETLRLPGGEPPAASDRPTTTLADRPAEATRPNPASESAPSVSATAPTPPATTTTRLRDPLAIPGGEPKGAAKAVAEPPRVSAAANSGPRPVPGTVTGKPAATPAPPSAAPAKTGDVPVAPLD